MKRLLFFTVLISLSNVVFAQKNDTPDCNLESERIELIKVKIKSDSIYEQFEPKIKT